MNNKQQVDPSQATRDAIVQEELWIVSFEASERMINAEIERLNKDLVAIKDKIQKKKEVVAELSKKINTA